MKIVELSDNELEQMEQDHIKELASQQWDELYREEAFWQILDFTEVQA